MNMSESIDHSGNNGGNNGEMVHVTDNSAALTNLNIDATVKPPPVDSGGDDKGFVSPRTLILEAKSLEGEDLPKITNTNVKAKHKWIEETLLKDTDSNNNKQPLLSENTQKILASRRSLSSGNSSSGVPRNTSQRSKEDVLARARKAIDGRRKSREILSIAKAKVHADLASMGDDKKVISASVSTSCEQDDDDDDRKESMVDDNIDTVGMDKPEKEKKAVPSVNDVRAKAQARLNASKALLLAANSLGKKTSVPKSVASSHSEGKNISEHNEGTSNGDDQGGNEDEVQANTQLEEDKVAGVSDKQAELDDPCEQEKIEKEMLLAEAEEEQAERELAIQRQKEGEIRAEKLEQQRLATEAARQAIWEKLSQQRQHEEEERRVEQERMKLAKHVAARESQEKQAKSDNDDDVSSNNDTTQASINFDPINNDSSSFSTGMDNSAILNKLSETSSAGQVDRMLYQGKRRAQFNRGGSEEEDDEDEQASGNSYDESASQVSSNNDNNADGVIDNVKQVLPHGIEKSESQSSELPNVNIDNNVAHPVPPECDDDNKSVNMNFDNNVVPIPRENLDDNTNMGPMWTRAKKEAEMAASWENEVRQRDTLAEDNIDHSPSIVPDPIDLESNKSSSGQMEKTPENSQYHHQVDLDGNPSTDRGLNLVPTLDRIVPTMPNVLPKKEVGLQELSGVWKGFNRNRMKFQGK